MTLRPDLPASFRALRLVARVSRRVRQMTGTKTVYVDERVAEYRGYWEAAASILGAEFVPLTDSLWEIRLGERRTRVANYVAGRDDSVTRRIAGDKLLCYRLAGGEGVPVPEHRSYTLHALPDASTLLRSVPVPVVVKPLRDTASGLGITTSVTTVGRLRSALALASLYSNEILVERMMPGESYRLLYLDGRLLHAVRRRGLRVTGDGRSSVHDLAAGAGEAVSIGPLEFATLASQGLEISSIPEKGRSVLIRGVASGGSPIERRTIYDEDATHLISAAVDDEARRVVRAVGSTFAGVDIVTPDPSRSLAESGGAFLEINTTPGIHHHYITSQDLVDHPVPVAVLRSLLSPPDREPPEYPSSNSRSSRTEAEITHLFALESL